MWRALIPAAVVLTAWALTEASIRAAGWARAWDMRLEDRRAARDVAAYRAQAEGRIAEWDRRRDLPEVDA